MHSKLINKITFKLFNHLDLSAQQKNLNLNKFNERKPPKDNEKLEKIAKHSKLNEKFAENSKNKFASKNATKQSNFLQFVISQRSFAFVTSEGNQPKKYGM